MTTDGSNGAPESAAQDDPFAYLYRPAEGESASPAAATPGQPRTSYARPMEVGRAQYGQQPRPPYGQSPQAQAAPQTQPVPQQQSRYAERSRPQPGEERPSGGRGKVAVIGAVAVLAAIAIGSGIALSGGDPGKTDAAKSSTSPSAPAGPSGSTSASGSAAPSVPPPSTDTIADASKLQALNAPSGNSIKNAVSKDGSYVTLQGGPTSTVSWTISVASAGTYKFWVHYNNPGADIPATVMVNGKESPANPLALRNYTHSSDPDQAWTRGSIWPELQAGANTLSVSVPAGSSVAIDQVAIRPSSDDSAPWR